MATTNLGRIGFVLQGDWVAGTYRYLDVVKHTGGSWACSVLSTTEEPSDIATDWQNIATDATAEVVDDASPQLGGPLDANSHMIHASKGSDIASGAALTIPTDGNYFVVTGTTMITSINTTSYVGTRFVLRFSDALTLTHNATSLILPGGVSIITQTGDVAEFVEYGSGNFICVNYTKADGTSISNTIEDLIVTGSITEEVYSLTGTDIDPTNGTIQYKTLSTNTTLTESLADGQAVLLRLAGGDSYTVTWFTVNWIGGEAPTLTANDALVFWQEGTTVYGSYLGTLVQV